MFKLKPIYEYLGDPDEALNARAVAWCPTCAPPEGLVDPYIAGAEASATAAGFLEPKVCRLTDTTALVVYRSSAATTLRCKVATVAADLSITYGVEQTVVTSIGINSLNLVYLSDDRALLMYMQATNCTARVLDVSGTVVTVGALTVVNTQSNSTYSTNPIRSALLASDTVLMCFSNSDNNKPSLQILTISALSVVTAGSVAKGTSTNCTRHGLALLSSTEGVTVSNATTRAALEQFTISGGTVTFSGVVPAFPNASQLPIGTYSQGSAFIHPIDASSVLVVGVTTTISPVVSSAMYSYILEVSGSSITSTTILKQSLEVGTLPVSLYHNGKSLICYRKFVSGTDYIPRLLLNTVGGSTPVAQIQRDPVTALVVANPEMCELTSENVFIAWEGGAAGTTVTSMAVKII